MTRANRIIRTSSTPTKVVEGILESYLPKITPREWYVLGAARPASSGSHGFGDSPEFPASDVWEADWSHEMYWHTEKKDEAIVAPLLAGRVCALAFAKSDASSFHLDIGEAVFLVELDRATYVQLEDLSMEEKITSYPGPRWNGFTDRGKKLYAFEEFAFPGFDGLRELAKDRRALDNFEMPPPSAYRPKPGEGSEEYMGRRINAAQASAEADRLRKQQQTGQRPRRDGD